jgi:hypothetical protein
VRSRSASATADRIGEDQLGDAVAGGVATEVDHVQPDAGLLQLTRDSQRIKGGPEHPVELRRDHHVARLQGGEQRGAVRTVGEGFDRARQTPDRA